MQISAWSSRKNSLTYGRVATAWGSRCRRITSGSASTRGSSKQPVCAASSSTASDTCATLFAAGEYSGPRRQRASGTREGVDDDGSLRPRTARHAAAGSGDAGLATRRRSMRDLRAAPTPQRPWRYSTSRGSGDSGCKGTFQCEWLRERSRSRTARSSVWTDERCDARQARVRYPLMCWGSTSCPIRG